MEKSVRKRENTLCPCVLSNVVDLENLSVRLLESWLLFVSTKHLPHRGLGLIPNHRTELQQEVNGVEDIPGHMSGHVPKIRI